MLLLRLAYKRFDQRSLLSTIMFVLLTPLFLKYANLGEKETLILNLRHVISVLHFPVISAMGCLFTRNTQGHVLKIDATKKCELLKLILKRTPIPEMDREDNTKFLCRKYILKFCQVTRELHEVFI